MRTVLVTVARDERQGRKSFFAFAVRCRQENCAMRLDVLARPAGFPGGHALLAHRPTDGMGQGRHCAPRDMDRLQSKISPDSLLATRKHDFAGARDLHRERAEMRKMPDSSLAPKNWCLP